MATPGTDPPDPLFSWLANVSGVSAETVSVSERDLPSDFLLAVLVTATAYRHGYTDRT
jgi:hypothetical protein